MGRGVSTIGKRAEIMLLGLGGLQKVPVTGRMPAGTGWGLERGVRFRTENQNGARSWNQNGIYRNQARHGRGFLGGVLLPVCCRRTARGRSSIDKVRDCRSYLRHVFYKVGICSLLLVYCVAVVAHNIL